MLEQRIEDMPGNTNSGNTPGEKPFLRAKDRAIVIIVFMTLAAVILAVYIMVHS